MSSPGECLSSSKVQQGHPDIFVMGGWAAKTREFLFFNSPGVPGKSKKVKGSLTQIGSGLYICQVTWFVNVKMILFFNDLEVVGVGSMWYR